MGDEDLERMKSVLESKGVSVRPAEDGPESSLPQPLPPPTKALLGARRELGNTSKVWAHVASLTPEERGAPCTPDFPVSPHSNRPRRRVIVRKGRNPRAEPFPNEFRCWGCKGALRCFPTMQKLITHQRLAHGGKVCLCGEKDTVEHRSSCPIKKNLQCSQHGKSFKEMNSKLAHWRTEHLDCHCPFCGELFKNKKLMQDHFSKEHPQLCRRSCSQCQAHFPTVIALQRHRKDVHPNRLSCPVEGCDYTCCVEHNMKRHVAAKHGDAEQARWVCKEILPNGKVCGSILANKDSYNKHVQHFHREGSRVCRTCLSKFKNYYELNWHRDNVHQDGTKYECENCKRGFHTKFNFEQHKCNRPPFQTCKICQGNQQKHGSGSLAHNTDPLGCGFEGHQLDEDLYGEKGSELPDKYQKTHVEALKRQKKSLCRSRNAYVYLLHLIPKGALGPGMSARDWFLGKHCSERVLRRFFYVGVSNKPKPSPYHLDSVLRQYSSVGKRMDQYDVILLKVIQCKDHDEAMLLESRLQIHISLRNQLLNQYVLDFEADPLEGAEEGGHKLIIPVPVWKYLSISPFLMKCSENEWKLIFELARILERDPICCQYDCQGLSAHNLPPPLRNSLGSFPYRARIHINWAAVRVMVRNHIGEGQVRRLIYLLKLNGYTALRGEGLENDQEEEEEDSGDEQAFPGSLYEVELDLDDGEEDNIQESPLNPTTNALWDALKDWGPSPVRDPILRVAAETAAVVSRNGALMALEIQLTDGNQTEPVFLMGNEDRWRVLRTSSLFLLKEYEVVAHGSRTFILIRDFDVLGFEENGSALGTVPAKDIHPDVEDAILYDHEARWERGREITRKSIMQRIWELEEETKEKLTKRSIQRMLDGDGGIREVDLIIVEIEWSLGKERCWLILGDGVDQRHFDFYPRKETRVKLHTLEVGAILRILGYMVRFLPGGIKVVEILDFEIMEEPGEGAGRRMLHAQRGPHFLPQSGAPGPVTHSYCSKTEEPTVEELGERNNLIRDNRQLNGEYNSQSPVTNGVRQSKIFEIITDLSNGSEAHGAAVQERCSEGADLVLNQGQMVGALIPRSPQSPPKKLSRHEDSSVAEEDSWVKEPWESQEKGVALLDQFADLTDLEFGSWSSQEGPTPIRNLDHLDNSDIPHPPLYVRVAWRGVLGRSRIGQSFIHFHVVGEEGGRRMLFSAFGFHAERLAQTFQVGKRYKIEGALILPRGASYNFLDHRFELRMGTSTKWVERN